MIEEVLRSFVAEEVRRVMREELALQRVQSPVPALASEDRLLPLVEAAAFARVSVTTVRQWVAHGQLKQYGSGRLARVSRAELLASLSRPISASVTGDAEIERLADAVLTSNRGNAR